LVFGRRNGERIISFDKLRVIVGAFGFGDDLFNVLETFRSGSFAKFLALAWEVVGTSLSIVSGIGYYLKKLEPLM